MFSLITFKLSPRCSTSSSNLKIFVNVWNSKIRMESTKVNQQSQIEYIKKHILSYPNFPKPGILFRDIFGILKEPRAYRTLKDLIVDYARTINPKIDYVVGLESRGFVIAPLIALELEIPFLPIRKKGKLPGETEQVDFSLEYGEDSFEIQLGTISCGSQVLIVDDLLATGGSLSSACQLIDRVGGKVACCLVIMELTDLKGRDKVDAPIHTLVKY